MKAILQSRWQEDGFDVFLIERHFDGIELFEMREAFGVMRPARTEARHVEGREPKPTMFLPRDVIEAIAAAAKDELRVTDIAADAIADARGVRDRLLMLVEELLHQPATPGIAVQSLPER